MRSYAIVDASDGVPMAARCPDCEDTWVRPDGDEHADTLPAWCVNHDAVHAADRERRVSHAAATLSVREGIRLFARSLAKEAFEMEYLTLPGAPEPQLRKVIESAERTFAALRRAHEEYSRALKELDAGLSGATDAGASPPAAT